MSENNVMTDTDKAHRHAVALFRYGVIAELVRLESGAEGLYEQIAERAARDYVIPGTTRTRVAAETIRHWMKCYRQGGFDALVPKPRADRGRPRKIPDDVAELLISIKESHPKLPVRGVIAQARASGELANDVVLAPSTVNRLLTREGLMGPRSAATAPADRRRFAFSHPGELWMSDVMHGPAVAVPGKGRRKAYLIAFLDDATRVIPYAAFALRENTAAFLPVFKQALMRRGLPERLYVDNGAAFRGHHLALTCAKLGIALIHARPYQPQGKGKLERWFRTVRAQLIPALTSDDTASLEALNRKLWAYVEGEYHQAPHRSLAGDTPLERWARSAERVNYPDAALDLDALFLFEVTRRVQRDRTVSLNGVVYEVDAALVGEKVTLRFDPAAPPTRAIEVWYQARRLADATPVDAYANCFVKRDRLSSNLEPDAPPPEPKPGLALRRLRGRDTDGVDS